MAKGDHIYVHCPGFTHHGIDMGDGTVIHYEFYTKGGKVKQISKNSFGSGKTIHVKQYKDGECNPPDIVVSEARKKLNQGGYCLVSNNCEHFAYECKTGIKKSEQVDNVKFAGGGISPVVTTIATKAATKAATKSLNPIAKGMVKVGLKQAPKVAGRAAVGIAGAGGIVTGLAADAVVGKVLEDDKRLPQDERDARKAGRIAGQVASTAGAVGGGVAAAMIGGGVAIAGAVAAPAILGVGVGLGVHKLLKKKKK